MPIAWRDRAFTTEEAAALAGTCRASLATWLHRFSVYEFSTRRKARRLFSPRDITTIRAALALNAGMPLREAIPTALQHLLHRPLPDVFLIVDRGRGFTSDADTAARFAVERGAIVIAIGTIAAEVESACAALFMTDPAKHQKRSRTST